jgi:hypothetical protein
MIFVEEHAKPNIAASALGHRDPARRRDPWLGWQVYDEGRRLGRCPPKLEHCRAVAAIVGHDLQLDRAGLEPRDGQTAALVVDVESPRTQPFDLFGTPVEDDVFVVGRV